MEINFYCPVCERVHGCENYQVVSVEFGVHSQWCCSEECALKLRQTFTHGEY